jgi:gamma-glutamyl-gamma-aminobutyraldehyde dehydrogenase
MGPGERRRRRPATAHSARSPFARDVESGIVWVNTYGTGDPTSPWGGFKQSGFGRDKSLEAMTQYTQSKSVWINLSQEP